jgi:hypothetical protein
MIGSYFFPSSMAIAANAVLFSLRRRIIIINPMQSRATVPMRYALVLAVTSQRANVPSLLMAFLTYVTIVGALIRTSSGRFYAPALRDPMLVWLANCGSTFARTMIVVLVVPMIMTIRPEHPIVPVYLALAMQWTVVHFGLLAIVWFANYIAGPMLGNAGHNPIGLVFFGGWIVSLYLLLFIL